MILDRLFMQFDDGKRLTFASWFMDKVGRRLLGSLQANGIEVMPELEQSFFHIKEDRFLPMDAERRKMWIKESILLAQFRAFAAPRIALATAIASSLLALALVGGGGFAHQAKIKVQRAQCEGLRADIEAGKTDLASISNQTLTRCARLMSGGAK